MMDTLSPRQRSKNMAAIHSKDTRPEMIVRRWLWGRGFRYRINDRRLPGHPDLVLRKYRTCVFVNGCFWHGHDVALSPAEAGEASVADGSGIHDSACCKIPKTNRDFWVAKIRRNQERDRDVIEKLKLMGWHTVTVWECELKPKQREQTLRALANTLHEIRLINIHPPKLYDSDDYYDFEVPVAAEREP